MTGVCYNICTDENDRLRSYGRSRLLMISVTCEAEYAQLSPTLNIITTTVNPQCILMTSDICRLKENAVADLRGD